MKVVVDREFGKCLATEDDNAMYSLDRRIIFRVNNVYNKFTIPDSVEILEEAAFSCCYSLQSVIIPDSVKSIGDYAFSDCSSLKSVIIPDSVKSIGEGAFADCSSLKSVVIPDSVKSIGNAAFSGCVNLYIKVNEKNKLFSSFDGILFDKRSKELLCGYSIASNICIIPAWVESIGDYAFSDCLSLESVIIPDSVKSIGGGAFYNCSSLKSVVIPDSVKSIGGVAFWGCSLSIGDISKAIYNQFPNAFQLDFRTSK